MQKIAVAIALLLISLGVNGKEIAKISGKITTQNHKPITGATIEVKELPKSYAISDSRGEYTLSIPEGSYTIEVKFLGYNTHQQKVSTKQNSIVNITLEEQAVKLDEVVVSTASSLSRLKGVQIGVEQISIKTLSLTPALFGENDVIKSITLLPGVKAEGDGSSGFQVRGGTSSQNLILLDDASIYNSGHVLGIFSVFNDNALNSAALYKGQIPAMFGCATSSVLDIQSRSGNYQDFSGAAEIGLLSTKAYIETPIVKDKLSLFVAGRRSYFDLFLKLTDEYKNNSLHFYDVNAKLNYKVSENDLITISYFRGEDLMGLNDLMSIGWGNDALTLNWLHRYNNSLNCSTSVVATNYATDNSIDISQIECEYQGYIRNLTIKQNYSYNIDKHKLHFGFQSTWIDVLSAKWRYNDLEQSEQRQGWDNSIWINDQWSVNSKLELSAGIRFNLFSAMGGSPYYTLDSSGEITSTIESSTMSAVENYLEIEPRFSMNYKVGDNQSLKLGYSRSSQNIHALRNSSTTSMPFDRYTMSSNLIEPEVANQIALGYIALTKNQMYEFSAEGYYKGIENVYDYKDGKTFNSEIEIEKIILGGKGRAYGAEFTIRKNLGNFTGWIGYTLSWVESQIDGINNNNWYRASNDRRHDLTVVAMYQFKNGWSGSACFLFNTGQALTVPSAKYQIEGETYYYYNERNNYNAPNYHRLDVSFSHTKKGKRYIRKWNFGCYNIYNHYNPYMVYFEDSTESATGTQAIQYSLFGIIPSVSYGIEF